MVNDRNAQQQCKLVSSSCLSSVRHVHPPPTASTCSTRSRAASGWSRARCGSWSGSEPSFRAVCLIKLLATVFLFSLLRAFLLAPCSLAVSVSLPVFSSATPSTLLLGCCSVRYCSVRAALAAGSGASLSTGPGKCHSILYKPAYLCPESLMRQNVRAARTKFVESIRPAASEVHSSREEREQKKLWPPL